MTVVNNRRVVVVSRPTKGPEEANFKLITHNQVDVSSDSSLKDGEVSDTTFTYLLHHTLLPMW